MAYKITVRVYQSDTSTFFSIVEKTVWNFANDNNNHQHSAGTWYEANGEHVLTMGKSGVSGSLRLKSCKGEEVIFLLGVHNYKPWCDAVPDAQGGTCLTVNAEYYNDGWRCYQRHKQLPEWSAKGPAGRNFKVKYTVTDGHHLRANLIIK